VPKSHIEIEGFIVYKIFVLDERSKPLKPVATLNVGNTGCVLPFKARFSIGLDIDLVH
jgi:hypothetical protein